MATDLLILAAERAVDWLRDLAGDPVFRVRWKIGPGTKRSLVGRVAGRTDYQGRADVELTITDVETKSLAVVFETAKGNPAKVDGAPQWSVSDPAILEIVAAPDGFSAQLSAVGPLGTGQVVVKADADLGQGVREIIGVADVSVEASEAVVARIQPA